MAAIKEAYPNVLATMIEVDKAYHSHHMTEFGNDYCRAMQACGVIGSIPSQAAFLSNTRGRLLGNEVLGPGTAKPTLSLRYCSGTLSLHV